MTARAPWTPAVGERVRVYGLVTRPDGNPMGCITDCGVFVFAGVDLPGELWKIKSPEDGCIYAAHPKQCRRLVRRERRRVYVKFYNDGRVAEVAAAGHGPGDWIEFVEAHRK
jgi:hypothetical protein